MSKKISRNTVCPCGSGRKYKRCCGAAQAGAAPAPLPRGRFFYEHGSYGLGPGISVPSIVCHKEVDGGTWRQHFVLVKPDQLYNTHEDAAQAAEAHLASAQERRGDTGSIMAFAEALKAAGYVRMEGGPGDLQAQEQVRKV